MGSEDVLRDLHEGLHSDDGQLATIRAKLEVLLLHLSWSDGGTVSVRRAAA